MENSESPSFAVRHVTTAAAACEAVQDGGIDVVILDLGLPDATDLQALNRLQECVDEIPVIVLTGQGDETLADGGTASAAPRTTCSRAPSATTRCCDRSATRSSGIAACATWRA